MPLWLRQEQDQQHPTHPVNSPMASLSFGLIADVQHADKETVSFDGRPQRYRESKRKLHAALQDFSSHQQQQFVLTLGDIIDGYPATDEARVQKTSADLQMIAQMFDSMAGKPVHHVLGNHCLAASREELLKALHMPHSYYSVDLSYSWRLIVLDTTEMSLHSGYPEDSQQMQEAKAWLAAHTLDQYPNAQSWNGGCTKQQLCWLQEQLADAAAKQQQVIVACHHPVAPGSAPDMYFAWGNDELFEILCADSSPVKVVFTGHYHVGGYACHKGVHFVVLEGVLEAPADSNAYAHVEVQGNTMQISGVGVASTRALQLR